MQRRVMLWGMSGDSALEAVRTELIRRDAPHVLLDQRAIAHVRFDWESGHITLENEVVHIADVGAIFVRPYDVQLVIEEAVDALPDADAQRRAIELEHLLFAWTDIADALVINRPSAMSSNSSKPYQAELISRHGFEIPATLVTTTPDVAREFIARHGEVIYKSVSDVRSTVSRVDAAMMEEIDDVANCPTQFQAYVPGTDWRVHVVGDDVFACDIQCAADDYRFPGEQELTIRAAQLPEPIAARCHALAHSLDLPLAGVDLRRTDDDAWYCFEVNPAPAFTYYEYETGQPLSAAVARVLSTTHVA